MLHILCLRIKSSIWNDNIYTEQPNKRENIFSRMSLQKNKRYHIHHTSKCSVVLLFYIIHDWNDIKNNGFYALLYVVCYVRDIIILKFITNRKTACDTKILRLHSATNNMTTTCVLKMCLLPRVWGIFWWFLGTSRTKDKRVRGMYNTQNLKGVKNMFCVLSF